MHFYTVRWSFVSDGETWVSSFVVKPEGESVYKSGRDMLHNMVSKMYLGEEIEIIKEHSEPLETGLIRSWRPTR